jgi:hypothetical protein
MTKAEYSERHKRRMNKFERMFTPVVFKAINSQVSSFIREIRSRGIDEAKRSMDTVLLNGNVAEAIKQLYKVVGIYFAKQTALELKRQEYKQFGVNEEWAKLIESYFRLHLLTKAVIPITETTKKQILEVLSQAQMEGWGVERIIRELSSPELTVWRARMIVRTESNKAMFYGQQLGEKESQWESTKLWIAAKDHRTRHSHKKVDGERIDANGKFSVPVYKNIGGVEVQMGFDMMEGPGDPEATAGNVINCRCVIARRLKKDENGKFIRKRNLISI